MKLAARIFLGLVIAACVVSFGHRLWRWSHPHSTPPAARSPTQGETIDDVIRLAREHGFAIGPVLLIAEKDGQPVMCIVQSNDVQFVVGSVEVRTNFPAADRHRL